MTHSHTQWVNIYIKGQFTMQWAEHGKSKAKTEILQILCVTVVKFLTFRSREIRRYPHYFCVFLRNINVR